MLTTTMPYRQTLGDNLVMKSINSAADAERLDAFNQAIYGADLKRLTYALIMHHPRTRPEEWLIVEDESNGEIVSSLCLLPWSWRYGDVELQAGEMGIVGTLPAYRGRGLVRVLVARHHELLAEGGYDVSHIQGIPHFYKQFGYDYAIQLEGGWRIDFDQIPAVGGDAYQFRRVTQADIPQLALYYDEAAAMLDVSVVRDTATWTYLLEHGPDSEIATEFYIVCEDDEPLGYFAVALHGFGDNLIVSEVSALKDYAVLASLAYIKQLALERKKPFIRLKLPTSSDMVRVARDLGAQDVNYYAWQLYLPDVPRLLRKIAPELEKRLVGSLLAGLTQDVRISLYNEALVLRFAAGKLESVEQHGTIEDCEISIPPNILPALIFGYRSVQELRYIYHDLRVDSADQVLLEALFPKLDAYLYSNY